MKLPSATTKAGPGILQQLLEVCILTLQFLYLNFKIVSLYIQLFYALLQLRYLRRRVRKLSFDIADMRYLVSASQIPKCLDPIKGIHGPETKKSRTGKQEVVS